MVCPARLWHTRAMRARASFLALPCCTALALSLSACAKDPPVVGETETDTGEPSCLDTDSPGEDIVINFDSDIAELQLGECVPETIIITGGGVTNLTGLSNLREVGRLEVRYAPQLTTLSGLQDLVRVDTLIITGNSAMTTLLDFNDLATLGSVVITANDGLTDLGSFPAATSLGRLEIASNNDLTDVSGFEELTSVSGTVRLADSPLFQSFAGLDKLTTIGGNLEIEDNPVLASLEGLDGLVSIGGDLRIITNESLSECLVMDFAAAIDIGGAEILSGNMSDLCG
jgi:hypothetical protein